MNKESKILVGIGIVVLAIGGVLWSSDTSTQPRPDDATLLVRDNSHMTGKKDAKVTLVEFGDYQCPSCRAVHPYVKQIKEEYSGNPDFNFVFRNFPLTGIHASAMISAKAAESAGQQGKYWEMQNLIFEKQDEWSGSGSALDIFIGYAKSLGLDEAKFRSGIEADSISEFIDGDLRDANDLRLSGTPTFFINGEKFTGSPTYEGLKAAIEGKLK